MSHQSLNDLTQRGMDAASWYSALHSSPCWLITAPSLELPEPSAPEVGGRLEALRPLLAVIAIRRFRVPAVDAEGLVQEVFASYLASDHLVRDVKSWLVGAICNACRYYWRVRERTVPLPDDAVSWPQPGTENMEERLVAQLSVRQALGFLDLECREILRLRFEEGHKVRELAAVLKLHQSKIARLLYACVERLKSVYHRLGAKP